MVKKVRTSGHPETRGTDIYGYEDAYGTSIPGQYVHLDKDGEPYILVRKNIHKRYPPHKGWGYSDTKSSKKKGSGSLY